MPEGESAPYTVVLTSQPTDDVMVEVTVPPGTDVSVNQTALTFTAVNWSMAQEITVSVAGDVDAEADPVVRLAHEVSGGDYGANGVTAESVTVTIDEDDTGVGQDRAVAGPDHSIGGRRRDRRHRDGDGRVERGIADDGDDGIGVGGRQRGLRGGGVRYGEQLRGDDSGESGQRDRGVQAIAGG